ncbi:MAG: FUSC family protein [Actinobacteria bacterium]|nr:FUSC family protein [Actinomycetota bacterium]
MSRDPRTALGAWFRSSRRMLVAELSHGGWLNFGPFRWDAVDVPRAVRAGIGMVTPLAIGLATGHLEYGVFAALGAQPAGIVSFQGASRTRLSAVTLAALGMAVSTWIGGVAAWTSGWLLFPAVLVFSYLAGLLAVLGQRFGVVGLQWAIQLVIASAIPLAPGDALVRAGLVLAGGLWQGVLVIASWAVIRSGRERASLETGYRALARYAEDACRRPPESPAAATGSAPGAAATSVPPLTFDTAAIADPNPLLRAQERYRFLLLLEQAERIRVSLAAVARYGSQCELLEPVSRVLDGLADALDAARDHARRAAELEQMVAAIQLPAGAPWRWAGATLLGELRGAVRILRRLDERDVGPTPDPPPTGRRRWSIWRAKVRSAAENLTAAAGTETEAGRHALRLAVVAGIGEIIAQASGLPHGYWIVLTALIVLRPDYASTIFRGVQRAAGTVVGAGLGLATALLLHVGPGVLVAVVGVTMTVSYAVFAVNYLLFAVFLTDFVVTLLALLGQTAEQTVVARLIGTGIGAALALIGYLAWPSWEGESAQQKLARLFETQAQFCSLLLRAYVRPDPPDRGAIAAAARTARRARTDAEASADRLADEPPQPPLTARLAYGLTGIGRRLAHVSLTLNAALESTHPGRDRPAAQPPDHAVKAVDEFADGVDAAARVIAGSLRSLRPPADMPPLRELQSALYQEVTDDGQAAAHGAPPLGTADLDTVLVSVTDEYTDAFATAADVLRQRLGGEPPPPSNVAGS